MPNSRQTHPLNTDYSIEQLRDADNSTRGNTYVQIFFTSPTLMSSLRRSYRPFVFAFESPAMCCATSIRPPFVGPGRHAPDSTEAHGRVQANIRIQARCCFTVGAACSSWQRLDTRPDGRVAPGLVR
jgi:hypothetical protein